MSGIIENARAQRDAEARASRPIDYERMNAVFPRQKAELTRARHAYERACKGLAIWEQNESPAVAEAREKLAAVIKRHVAVWNEIGAWPDAWHTWQIALDDALGLYDHIDISLL